MKILPREAEPASPITSLVASNFSTDEMIESENETMRDRLSDLERKVHEQNDEIMCLRSTLADALRRINTIEINKGSLSGGRSTPIKDGLLAGIKLRGSATDVRDSSKRPTSHLTARSATSTPSTTRSVRRPGHYQSTSSLHSDGHSSSSASPAPSPSPTSTNSLSASNSVPSRQPSHLSSPTPTVHFSKQGNNSLNKRWASSSDFASPSVNNHHTFGSIFNNNHSSALSNRCMNSGSLHNLSTLRVPHQMPGQQRAWRDALYNAEEGIVKFYLRGRPLHLYVPSDLKNSYHPQGPSIPPSSKLKLEWVYGYRGRDCRNNVQQLPTGEIVYFVAAVVVLHNVEEQTQRHYLGHTDDIKCLAIHPNKLIMATGQTAGHDRRDARSWRLNPPIDPLNSEAEEWPHVRIWDSVSLVTYHIIGISDFERSVACLAFSKTDGGGLLVAVDDAPDHNMSVWDWSRGERGYKLMETKCAADQVLAVEFSPLDRNTIITCGKNQLLFWLYENGMLIKRVGIFENRERPKYVTAISFTDTGNVISGDSNGNLLIWQRGGNRVEKSVKNAHDGPILTILVQKDGTIISGGKDGQVIEWHRELTPTSRIITLPDIYGVPRVIVSGRGSRLIIGTTRNCILGGTFTLPLNALMQGHTEELWALAPHPCQNQFLTGGYDKTCYLWDTMAKTIVWSKDIGEPIQSATFCPSGEVIIIATVRGRWLVMDSETRETYSQHQDGNEPIQVVKFSPNGRSLAIGSRDNNLYIYQVSEDFRKYSRIGRCQGHSSFITHLDWSKDNQFLQSNSGDYELLHWNASLCRQIVQPSQMKDVEWASQSCTLGFSTLGIWTDGADGTDINTCARANDRTILVTGDDFGKVKLFSNPACYQKSTFVEASGHSSHITAVDFLCDDSRLLSTGGKDTTVMQWSFSSNSLLGSR